MRLRRSVLPTVVVGFATVAMPATTQAAPCRNTNKTPTSGSMGQARSATLCLLNVQRRLHGLPALHANRDLRTAATSYSRTMVHHRFFDHVGPDGSTIQQRLARAGYVGWTTIGENIAWGSGGFATPARIVKGWMHSPGHRANILRVAFRQIGIGIAAGAPFPGVDGAAAVYTTDFARPR
jgi:uncharacterized protein YkwD